MAEEKTNVMRILDQKKVRYTPHTYPYSGGAVDGPHVAELIGVEPERAFKTLVTRGASKQNYVFVVPVMKSLNLKAAAKAVGEKSIEMIHQAELLPLTGYVHGGCSPVGMKKQLKTVIDDSAQDLEAMVVSAGKIGYQVEVALEDLKKIVRFQLADVTE